MAERSEKLQQVSETEILRRFRESLVLLLPIMQSLDCVDDDMSPYDPFDRVADALWSEFVVNSFQWKYGLEQAPRLPAYGCVAVEPAVDGEIQVFLGPENRGRFVSFRGNRAFGAEPFNAVTSEHSNGSLVETPASALTEYRWVRRAHAI